MHRITSGRIVVAILLTITVFTVAALPSAETPPVAEFAFVANAQDGTVTGFRLDGSASTFTVPIGTRASHGIASSPDGRIVYAGDPESDELVVLDARDKVVVARVAIGHDVHGIDISPDGRTVWVGGTFGDDPMMGTLTAVDTASNTISRIVSPGLGSASHFSFTPDGKEIWVASTSTNLLWIVNTESGLVVGVVAALPPETPRDAPGSDDWNDYLTDRNLIGLNEVAVSPDGKYAYAIGPATSQLYKVDVARREVVASTAAGQRGHGVVVSPNGREVWVADWAGGVIIADARSLAVIERIPIPMPTGSLVRGANHIAFGNRGDFAYVTSVDSVLVIDTLTRSIAASIPVGVEPHEISLEDLVAERTSIDSDAIIRKALANRNLRGNTIVRRNGTDALPSFLDSISQTNTERSVVVTVTPIPTAADSGEVEFNVEMNTHSVELSRSLAEVARLRDNRGNTFAPESWDGPVGGHHVSGTLRFSGVDLQITDNGFFVQLELEGIGGVPLRSFRWE